MRMSFTCGQCGILTYMLRRFEDPKVIERTVASRNCNFSSGVPLEIVRLAAHGWNSSTQRCLLLQGFLFFVFVLFCCFLKKITVKMHLRNIIFYSSLVLVIFFCFLKNEPKEIKHEYMHLLSFMEWISKCRYRFLNIATYETCTNLPKSSPWATYKLSGRFVHTCNEESDSNFWRLTADSIWVIRLHLGKLIRRPRCSLLWCLWAPTLGILTLSHPLSITKTSSQLPFPPLSRCC